MTDVQKQPLPSQLSKVRELAAKGRSMTDSDRLAVVADYLRRGWHNGNCDLDVRIGLGRDPWYYGWCDLDELREGFAEYLDVLGRRLADQAVERASVDGSGLPEVMAEQGEQAGCPVCLKPSGPLVDAGGGV